MVDLLFISFASSVNIILFLLFVLKVVRRWRGQHMKCCTGLVLFDTARHCDI